MFAAGARTVEVDGQPLVLASLLRKGLAIAVDICLAVGCASLGLFLAATRVPLDTEGGRTPIAVVVSLAFLFLIWGRNRLVSPGREILALRLVRLAGPRPFLLGRQITVHRDPTPVVTNEQTTRAAVVIAVSTALAVFSLGAVLTRTLAFGAVVEYVAAERPFARGLGEAPRLESYPRALLIGRERAFVQVDAYWGEAHGMLNFHLDREGRGWRVHSVERGADSLFGTYSLGALEDDFPPRPPS